MLVRTLAIALMIIALATVLVVGVQTPTDAAERATAAIPETLLAEEDERQPVTDVRNRTGDPLYDSELPVAPVVGGTAAFLVVLSVIAVRRGWLI